MDLRRLPSPDDLLILLTVARLGRFNAVAETLGTTHTTISRRILALDKQLGGRTLERSPHGWELTELGSQAVAAAEAIEGTLGAALQPHCPLRRRALRPGPDQHAGRLRRRIRRAGPGPAAAGRTRCSTSSCSAPPARSARTAPAWTWKWWWATWTSPTPQAIFLSNYFLRLYASPQYAQEHGLPATLDDVRQHGFVSYVESALQVAELGHRSTQLPVPRSSFQATSIFAQLEAVRRGAGIGLLPNFLVAGEPGFLPVLPDDFQRQLPIWAVARPESLRSAPVQAVLEAIRTEIADRQEVLAG